jgi:cell division protein FtsZ
MVKEGLINLDFADVRSVMREMGKAMMGTGEASGERRATQAAEAAIANPLLDETSMRGAKGLLISITGGKDLTLFEVDEAATRIREEVDPDANIILGATFEEALEGVIRVSVVATGIEGSAAGVENPLEQQRLAEIKNRLRGSMATPTTAPAAQPMQQQPVRSTPQMPAARPAANPQPVARASEPGITIAPLEHAPQNYHVDLDLDHPAAAVSETEMETDEPFMPPPAEAPSRIPRVEDFPPVVQRQMEARRETPHHEDRGPMSLLRRLANVGLGRREEEPAPPAEDLRQPQVQRPAAKAQHQAQPQPRQAPPQPRATQSAPRQQAGQDSMYKPRAGDLDPHGRPLPNAKRSQQEDELEIPAFLRRQAN